MASKPVKLQRPGPGHRVQSLRKDMAANIYSKIVPYPGGMKNLFIPVAIGRVGGLTGHVVQLGKVGPPIERSG
jgi:hypothetical protein